jgi:hypothetical protein
MVPLHCMGRCRTFTLESCIVFASCVAAEITIAATGKRADWNKDPPLQTYSVPSLEDFQSASPFQAVVVPSESRSITPPLSLDGDLVDVPSTIDEAALDVWKPVLAVLCETLAANCEPTTDAGTVDEVVSVSFRRR